MFSKIRDLGLSTIDKAKQRANTLFTSMKDKIEEERKKPKGLGFSIFDKDEEKPKVTEPKTYEKAKTMIDKEQQEKNKMQKRADLLYPDKNEENKIDKKPEEKAVDVFKEKEVQEKDFIDNKIEKDTKEQKQSSKEIENDKNFQDLLKYLYPQEGGYSNRKEDLGGKTNLGVTQATYDWYNKKHNTEQKDVKNITKEEATKIYYDYYWKGSGASKIKDKKLALMYFDSAVNHGPYYAQKYYKQSNGDFDKFMELRKEHYDNMANKSEAQRKNHKGWMNRLSNLKKFVDENY